MSTIAETVAPTQQGASVVALQHELAQLNYYEGPIDGVLGPATLAAIKHFQRANGLAPARERDPWSVHGQWLVRRRHDDLEHRRHERRSVAPGIRRGVRVAVRPKAGRRSPRAPVAQRRPVGCRDTVRDVSRAGADRCPR
ncbi:MAG TPA: peptidoglycan-binding domain-containing protein [Solirubrobacteraceae bacterium]|nr:peptidoglycan-binding domain-containing protein [Solirubrobacteraceae bacterium]